MFDSATLTFRAKPPTVARLEELTRQTGLSRGRLLALLIERAEVEPVIGYSVKPVSLGKENGSGKVSEARAAVPA